MLSIAIIPSVPLNAIMRFSLYYVLPLTIVIFHDAVIFAYIEDWFFTDLLQKMDKKLLQRLRNRSNWHYLSSMTWHRDSRTNWRCADFLHKWTKNVWQHHVTKVTNDLCENLGWFGALVYYKIIELIAKNGRIESSLFLITTFPVVKCSVLFSKLNARPDIGMFLRHKT